MSLQSLNSIIDIVSSTISLGKSLSCGLAFNHIPSTNTNSKCLHINEPESTFTIHSLLVQLLEFLAPDIGQSGALMRAHECPVCIRLDPLHEEVRDPEGIEKVACAALLLAYVLLAVEEVEDVDVPRLEVDSEGTGALCKGKHE